MIVAISYHAGDLSLMTRWAKHVAKLNSYPKHRLILVPIRGVDTDVITSTLAGKFQEIIIEKATHTQTGWPISCNMAFEAVAWLCSTKLKQPFLWMEPDAIPIQPQWIDSIELAYKNCGKPFMGDFVQIAGVMPNGIDHMSGIAVYDWDLHRKAPSIFNNEKTAWDIASAANVVPQMARTGLIQHDWVPTKEWRREKVDISCVNSHAVIYHPDKLGVLFDDGLVPNGTQGEPAAGVPCEGSPHETKDKPVNLYADTSRMINDLCDKNPFNIEMVINDFIQYAKQSRKNKKEVIDLLIKEGIIPKAKSPKQSRKKVRSSVGGGKRARVGSGIQVSSDSEVEG